MEYTLKLDSKDVGRIIAAFMFIHDAFPGVQASTRAGQRETALKVTKQVSEQQHQPQEPRIIVPTSPATN